MNKDPEKADRTGKTAPAGTAIGSTAIAAALLYTPRRKEQSERSGAGKQRYKDAPETD